MSDMPLSQMPVAPTKWRHLPTTVYERNYGFGINYYQPMIDYLDRKESDEAKKIPHQVAMPLTDARGYWEHKHIIPYSPDELARHTVGAEFKAKEHLEHFKVESLEKGFLSGDVVMYCGAG